MELKLKENLQEAYIFIPFINNNVVGKFIDKGLYPHLYNLYPEFFDVVEPKKTKVVDDILINNNTEKGGSIK